MTYIPPVRNQFEKTMVRVDNGDGSYHYEEKILRNAYWQGFMSDEDKRFFTAYDWTVLELGIFFDNLADHCRDEIADALDVHMTDQRCEDLGNILHKAFEKYAEIERNMHIVRALEDTEYPEPYKDGIPKDPAPADYKQRPDGLEGIEEYEPWVHMYDDLLKED